MAADGSGCRPTSLRPSVHCDFQMPAQHRHLFVEGLSPKRPTAGGHTCPRGAASTVAFMWIRIFTSDSFRVHVVFQLPGGTELRVFTVVAGSITHTFLVPFFPVTPPHSLLGFPCLPKQLLEQSLFQHLLLGGAPKLRKKSIIGLFHNSGV